MSTHESACFLGQGKTMDEAWNDGIGNVGHLLAGTPLPLSITLPDGVHAARSLSEFESERRICPKTDSISAPGTP